VRVLLLSVIVSDAVARERDFWDHVVPTVDEVIDSYEAGPALSAAAMLRACEPLKGKRVLDFACGGGCTSLWLAAAGANVVGVDLSPASVAIACEAAVRARLTADFRVVEHDSHLGGPYDAIIGHFALHHVDVKATAARLAEVLRPGGTAAFVETTADNPLLNWARRYLVGHFGVVRYGTLDEHPLTLEDRRTLRDAFGDLKVETPHYQFLRLFDRQILHFRFKGVSRLIELIDERLSRFEAVSDWSYDKLFIASKSQ
jgi:2-polyprenyl-3-methyl-5-hydroxy-6-metoxy-1,4-benzoquinol methylase